MSILSNEWLCCWKWGALLKSNTEPFVSGNTSYEFNSYKLVTKKNGQNVYNQTLYCTLVVSSPHKQQITYFSTVLTYREQYYLTVLKPYWLSKKLKCTTVHSKAQTHHMVTPALAGRITWVQVMCLIYINLQLSLSPSVESLTRSYFKPKYIKYIWVLPVLRVSAETCIFL